MVLNYRKNVAIFVLLTFFSLISLTAYPLHAQEQAGPQQGTNIAKTQDQPGAIEGESSYGKHKGGSSILPIILIVVGVGALAALLFLVILKTKYDLTGTWAVTFTGETVLWDGNDQPITSMTVVCKAGSDTTSGTWQAQGYDASASGTYAISDKAITVSWINYTDITMSGSFSAKDAASGTIHNAYSGTAGNWSGTRTSTATAIADGARLQVKKSRSLK